MEIVAGVAGLAGAVRFALLVWHGYRYGQVKSAALWSRYYDRQSNRTVYWIFMGLHSLGVLICLSATIYIVIDLLRAPR